MPRLTLLLLGPPELIRDGATIQVGRRKAIALVAYLAATRQRHSRDALATLFWPANDQTRARANLRRVLTALREAMQGIGLRIDRESIGLENDAGLWVDIWEFQSLLAASRAHDHAEAEVCSTCATSLAKAVALYRNDFLAGFTLRDSPDFDEWQFFQGEHLRQDLANALERLVYFHSARREFEPAITYARRWLALDPLHEPVHRHLMSLYAIAGQRSAALRQYDECVKILEEELGIPPQEETNQLYQAIKQRRTPPLMAPHIPRDGRQILADISILPLPETPPADSPIIPSQTRPMHLHNLPPQPTPFLGREEELAQVSQLLTDEPACRLLTLVGPGGIGKTRLAIQAASITHDAFQQGACFVPLDRVSSAGFLVSAIAEALNFSFYSSDDPKAQLLNYLRDKEILLVMDNFEHLVNAASLLAEILQTALKVKVLVTSRERLNLQGEWLFEVGGLTFPEDGDIEPLERYTAVQLFLHSARRVRSDFSINDEEKPWIARICQLVEGMPLGIELASAWVRVLPCADIAREIEKNLGFLTTSLRDVPERHRSLRAVFEHSWGLLSAEEKDVFTNLSVFHGGFQREAAEKVAGASLPTLLALVDKSLIRINPSGRYEMLEVIRQYAEEKLRATPEEHEKARTTHCQYYAEFLRQRQDHIKGGRQQETLAEVGEEIENVRSAWRWALENNMAEEIERSAETLYYFYDIRGWFQEGEETFRVAVDRLSEWQPDTENAATKKVAIVAKVRTWQSAFAYRLGLYTEAKQMLEESLATFRHLAVSTETAFSLNLLGDLARIMGNYAEAQQLLQESLALCQQTGDRAQMARALNNLGIVTAALGDLKKARQLFQEVLAIFKEVGDERGLTRALNNLGIVAYYLEEYAEAKRLYQESLELCRQTNSQYGVGISLNNLGLVAHDLGEYAESKQLHLESYTIFKEIGYQLGAGLCLTDLGTVACALGEHQDAGHYFRQALEIGMEIEALPVALYALVGMARLLSETGDKQRAIELLALTLSHPASDKDTRGRAEKLPSELESQLPADVVAHAREAGASKDFEQEVANLLLATEASLV